MPNLATKCPVCGAMLDEEDLFCANCGTEAPCMSADAPLAASVVAEHNFECQGCGASMSYDASAQALRCPFCGSEKLKEQKDTKMLRPESVVPFAIDQQQALARLRAWLGSSFWRPGDLAETAVVTKLTQVFVPHWVFSARVFTYWTADTSQTPPGARAAWAPVAGEHRAEYSGVLVGASSVLSVTETNAICPFDLSAEVAPEGVDLANVVYEQFRVQRKYARPLAQAGLDEQERRACSELVPGRCRNVHVNVRVEGLTGKPVLLPLWIMAYQYRGRLFRFLVNGQTGKCMGLAPVSYAKIALVAATVVIFGLLVLFFLAMAARGNG